MTSMKGIPVRDYDRELHSLLALKTELVPWGLVGKTDGAGLEAWRVLHAEFAPITSKSNRQLMKQVLLPKRANKHEELQSHQAEWELLLSKYEEITRKSVDEDVLMAAYESLLLDRIAETLTASRWNPPESKR